MKAYALLNRLLNARHFALLLLLLLLLTQAPAGLKNDMRGDDFLQWAIFTHNSLLAEKGLLPNAGDDSFWGAVSQQFHFFSPANNFLPALKNYGVMPWWSSDDAHLHLFRPLASLSHWLDYQLALPVKMMLGINFLVFLLVVLLLSRLYRSLDYSTPLLRLSLLLFALDFSLQGSLEWIASRNALIALAFSILSVDFFIRWRSQQKLSFCLLSLLFLLASVLSAEAGIATTAYLFAYVVCLDKAPWKNRIAALLPSAVLVISWRLAYQWAGFGAKNIDHYIDPVRDPGLIASKIISGVPIILGEQISNIDAIDRMLSPDMLLIVSLVSAVLVMVVIALLLPLLRHSARARFWLLAASIAAIPMCAIQHTDPRTLTFISMAFFPLWAEFVGFTQQRLDDPGQRLSSIKRLSWRLGRGWIIIAYIIVPLLVFSIVNVKALGNWLHNKPANHISQLYIVGRGSELQDRHVVVLAAPSPMLFMYAPYRMAYEDGVIPASIQVIAPAFSNILVRRLDAQRLLVEPESGFLLSKFDLLPHDAEYPLHAAKYGRNMMGFLSRDPHFDEGPVFHNDALSITVLQTQQGRPMSVELDFPVALEDDNYVFVYWDWNVHRFVALPELPIQGSLTIPGPFAPVQGAKTAP